MSGCIVGWAHGKFGKREGLDLEALIAEVAVQALADANVAPAEVDEIYVGHFGGGFVKQDFPASLVFQAAEALRFKPSTRVENACATGSAAVQLGLMSLAARKSRVEPKFESAIRRTLGSTRRVVALSSKFALITMLAPATCSGCRISPALTHR